MTSSRRLALAKFLKKAKSTKGGGDTVAPDVPPITPPVPVASYRLLHHPPEPAKRLPLLLLLLRFLWPWHRHLPQRATGGALVFKKRRATGVPTLSAASSGGGGSLRDDPPSATSPPPRTFQEEQDEGVDSVPSPLPLREAAEPLGSAPPASAPAPSSREPRIPRPVYRDLT